MATEQIRVAVETKDRVAQHSHDHDPFAHHVLDAPVTEAVAELTDVAPEFDAGMLPNRDHLEAALDAKDRLAAHGVRMPEDEAVWREELEEAVQGLQA